MPGKAAYQRVQIRLRADQLDESRVLNDYSRRSEILGRPDHDYLRFLLVLGHLFATKITSVEEGKTHEPIAISANESNNTDKERRDVSYYSESNATPNDSVRVEEPEAVVGTAIRRLAGVFGSAIRGS